MTSYQDGIIKIEGIFSQLHASFDFASGNFSISLSTGGISFGALDLAADVTFKKGGLDEVSLRTSAPFAGGFLKTNTAFSSSGFKSMNLTITWIRVGRLFLQSSTSYRLGHLTQDLSLQYALNSPQLPLSTISLGISFDGSLFSGTLSFQRALVRIDGKLWNIDYHGEIGLDTQGLRIQSLYFSERTGNLLFLCIFVERVFMLMSFGYLTVDDYMLGGGLGLLSLHFQGLGIIPVPIPFAFVGYIGTPVENNMTQRPPAMNAAVFVVLPMPGIMLHASLGVFTMSTFWMFDWGFSPQRGEVFVQLSM